MPVVTRRSLSRRATVGIALLLPVGATACDIDPPSASAPTSPDEVTATPRADSVLVGEMVTSLSTAIATIAAAQAAAPVLEPVLADLLAAHVAHRDLLASAAPDAPAQDPATVDMPPRARAALRVVLDGEAGLDLALREGLVAAESGDLARTLASMAASTTQFRTVLQRPGAASAAGVAS